MKKTIYLVCSLFIAFVAITSCDADDVEDLVGKLDAPSDVSLVFNITQDNTGLVTISPSATGAASFEVFYGDGSNESAELGLGENTQHVYAEGTYPVRLIATAVNGKTTEITQDLMVSFRAPENLNVTVEEDPNSNFGVVVSATADFATMFEVTFGEDPALAPEVLMLEDTVSYLYSSTGTYTITVTALSGGTATTTTTVDVTIIDPLLLPIDFESATLPYSFIDFGGALTSIIANPDPTGANTSANVASFVKTAGAQVFAGTIQELDAPIDFSTFQKIKMDSWSPLPAGTIVKMKLENAADPNIATEVDVATTAVSEWETLIFDFSAADLTQSYSKIIVFFDFGNAGNDDTFYFDNFELTNQSPVALEFPVNFENPTLNYAFTEFGGAPTAVIPNPDMSGLNTSGNVANLTKVSGSQPWAGSFFDLDNPIDFSNGDKIRMKTWSPQVGAIIKLKIENLSDPNINIEVDVPTTVANQWEELIFDFPTATTGDAYQRIVVFYDFGNNGAGEDFYFDDLEVTNGAPALTLPLDFENPALSYTWTDFGGAVTTTAANPSVGGINSSSTVANLNKSNGSQVWAGGFIELDTPIDFSSMQKLKVKTFSPTSGIVVKLKLENLADPNINTEVDVINTTANAWEELTFDFTGINNANDYQRVVLFFDFGNAGTGADYYYDDIILSN